MKRIWPRIIGVLMGLAVIGMGILFFVVQKSKLPQTEAEIWPEVVATVNGIVISRDMVETELKISRLNVLEPLPPLEGEDLRRAAEEALNQLINRQIILQAAAAQGFALDEATIQTYVDILFGTYGEEALTAALQQTEASHADLDWWVSEVMTVEAFSTEVIMAGVDPEARQRVYNDWLNEKQAQATVTRYLDQSIKTSQALVGQQAPDFDLVSLSGEPVSLADYQGQVVLLNFWATWCPSCTSEMPDYQQVYQEYQRADFVILAVNFQEPPEQVSQYAAGLGLTYPVLMDETGDVTIKTYQIVGMPGSILIDRQGKIVYRHLGPMQAEILIEKLHALGL